MSVVSTETQKAAVQTTNSERLHRLAIEAAKFLGLEVGDPLPTASIVKQGVANGYDKGEVRRWLRSEGYSSDDEMRALPQGNILGEQWRTHRAGAPMAAFSLEVQAFREWLGERREKRLTEYDDGSYQYPVEHTYSLRKAREKSAKARDVDRHFIEKYTKFTTVLVTYCAEKGMSEPIHQHASKFYPSALSRPRWEIFNRQINSQEYAGCRLLAPGKPEEGTPTPEFTHAHSIYWAEGWHSRENFEPLRDIFIDEVEGATPELNPLDEAIQVRHHSSAQVEGDTRVRRGDLDEERGPTTAASGEVSANLPLLRARNNLRERDASQEEWAKGDASNCPDWVEYWAAHLRVAGQNPEVIGSDDDAGGVSRWGTFGNFTEIADSMKDERDSIEDKPTEDSDESRFTFSPDKEDSDDKPRFDL